MGGGGFGGLVRGTMGGEEKVEEGGWGEEQGEEEVRVRGVECCGEEDGEAVEEDVGDQRGGRVGREEGEARLEGRPEDDCGLV